MRLAGGISAAALAGLVVAAPLCAQAVIVRATGPDAARFPVGQMLPKGSAITLQRGSVIGLIDKAGAWELRGVVKTRIGKRPVETSSRLQLIQELVKKRKRIKRLAAVAALPSGVGATGEASTRTRAGAPKGQPPATAAPPPPPASPQVQGIVKVPVRGTIPPAGSVTRVDSAWWQYPLGESGTFCLVPGQPFELARRAGPEQDVTFRDDTGGRVMTYRFGTDAEISHASPSDMPIVDGRFYTVEAANGLKTNVRFLPITAPTGPLSLAKSLAANGCTRQIEALSSESAITQAEAAPARP
jgi:hypothetical protein